MWKLVLKVNALKNSEVVDRKVKIVEVTVALVFVIAFSSNPELTSVTSVHVSKLIRLMIG